MECHLQCVRCKSKRLDVHDYESMIVISPKAALFTVECPECSARISSVRAIPPDMLDEVMYAAIEVDAGMGHAM